jgi:hypothetical protein
VNERAGPAVSGLSPVIITVVMPVSRRQQGG